MKNILILNRSVDKLGRILPAIAPLKSQMIFKFRANLLNMSDDVLNLTLDQLDYQIRNGKICR